MLLRVLIIILSSTVLPCSVWAQTSFYTNYDIEDGLPSSEVYDIEIDEKGQIWLTTDRGVCVYDGYEFKTYTTRDGLSNNTNFEIIKGKDGRFWFTGFDGGLSYYKDGVFQAFEKNEELEKMGDGRWIVNLIEDGNHIYFTKLRHQDVYFSLNLQTGESHSHDIVSAKNYVSQDEFGKNYQVNIGNKKIFFNDSLFFCSNYLKLRNGKELGLIYEQLVEFDEGKLKLPLTKSNYQPDYIYQDRFNHFWLGAWNGLYLFRNGDFSRPPEKYFDNIGITSIQEDRDGNYWIASLESGLYFVPSFEVKKYSIPGFQENYLFLRKLGKEMFVGTSKDHSFLLTIKDDKIESKQLESPIEFLTRAPYLRNYLSRNLSTQTGKHYSLESINSYYLPNLIMNNGHLIRSSVSGYSVVENNTGIEYYKSDSSNILREKRIYKIAKFGQEYLLIASMKGVYVLHQDSVESIKRVRPDSELLNTRISDIQMNDPGNVWIGTIGNGLMYYSPDTLIQFTEKEGLQSALINSIALYGDSIILVGSNKGLNKISYSTASGSLEIKDIEGYTTNDGLLSNYINYIEIIDDQIYLALNNGINYFKLADLQKDIHSPNIFLESALTLNDNQEFTSESSLKADQNDVVFSFKGISYNKPEAKPFYKYKLISGTDNGKWFYTNERSARFTNLAAGDYEFKVSARNKKDAWASPHASVNFTISPHFSDTWWFKLLVTAGVIAFLTYIWWSRSSNLRQKQKLQEALFRTKDAELSALRNQMNPHFVHNSLNSIQNYIFKNDIENANYYLTQFSMLMRNSLEFSKLNNITLAEEVNFLTMYMELEQLRFPDKFKFKLTVDPEIPQDLYAIPPLLIQPILENSVKYAFKKAKRNDGLIEVIIKDEKAGESISVVIQDNGSGIEYQDENKAQKIHKSIGLGIVKNRIDLLNTDKKNPVATFSFANRTDTKGLRTTIILPMTIKENDTSSYN